MELQSMGVQSKIYEIRGRRVMLDFDLAEMYGVETKSLNLSVKRNMKRFPMDFMFQLSEQEWNSLRLQIETSKRGGRRYSPYAFSEQGIAMLSGLLNSDIAIGVNIIIMRAFVAVREYLLTRASESVELAQLRERVFMLEQTVSNLSEDVQTGFGNLYNAIDELSAKPAQLDPNRRLIGYKQSDK